MAPPAVLDDPARAYGTPRSAGRIRGRPQDFEVEEQLGFEADGDGPHWLIRVRKARLNTSDVAGLLAAYAGVRPRDIGYSGLKDKHAVCVQWFTVPCSPGGDWTGFHHDGMEILDCRRHRRKLRRGTHRANRFRIAVVLDRIEAADLDRRLAAVRTGGVPSYFGEQRFGRRFESNTARLLQGGRLSRQQRGMTLSALRSALFNRVLDLRVRRGSWNTALPGEYVNLDGTRSGFAVEGDDPDVARRIDALDLHPTGPLYGAGANPATGEAADLENEIIHVCRDWCDVLIRAGLKMERRAARCPVRQLKWRLNEDQTLLELEFVLGRGQFATSVLREIVDYRDVTRDGAGDSEAAQAGCRGAAAD